MGPKQEESASGLACWSAFIAVLSALFALGFLAVRVFSPAGSAAETYAQLNQGDLFFGVLFLVSLAMWMSSGD